MTEKKSKPKKKKGLERALETKDAHRIGTDIPLIQDETVLVTPEMANEMLKKNKNNRPVSWRKVTEYANLMIAGKWVFHAQGIILDDKGNILTGQKRLWAVVKSGTSQYFRISRGSPADTAYLIDRGTPQSSRDLATRKTDRKHSPTEGSVCRAMYAIKGKIRPSVDEIAGSLVEHADILEEAMKQTRGVKKTKSVMMVMASICFLSLRKPKFRQLFCLTKELSETLEKEFAPLEAKDFWNRGAGFSLSMDKAVTICKDNYYLAKGAPI